MIILACVAYSLSPWYRQSVQWLPKPCSGIPQIRRLPQGYVNVQKQSVNTPLCNHDAINNKICTFVFSWVFHWIVVNQKVMMAISEESGKGHLAV